LDQLMDWYRGRPAQIPRDGRSGLGGGPGRAHQRAVGRQYRQAGGAPGRSHRM